MTRWPLLMLMVLIVSRALLVPATPVLAFQLLPQNFPQTTPYPVALDSPSSGPRPGPRITLSLDVPVGLLQILLQQARARAVKEQAAINSHILANVGRR